MLLYITKKTVTNKSKITESSCLNILTRMIDILYTMSDILYTIIHNVTNTL